MEFYDVINKRRTIRDFENRDIDNDAQTPTQVSATVEEKVRWNKW